LVAVAAVRLVLPRETKQGAVVVVVVALLMVGLMPLLLAQLERVEPGQQALQQQAT
jgi:hypothetical protein